MAEHERLPRPVRWRRVFLEAFVLISSILLALGAEALWQKRVDRAEERAILTVLRTEFVGNGVVLRAQADSIAEAMGLISSVLHSGPKDLADALESSEGQDLSMAIRRPWTVEFRVGALEGVLGTDRASLIQSHQLLSDLAQYQAVRHEIGEIGDLVTPIAVQAFVASKQLPEKHDELVALLEAKVGYWDAYLRYLDRLISQTEAIAAELDSEIR